MINFWFVLDIVKNKYLFVVFVISVFIIVLIFFFLKLIFYINEKLGFGRSFDF